MATDPGGLQHVHLISLLRHPAGRALGNDAPGHYNEQIFHSSEPRSHLLSRSRDRGFGAKFWVAAEVQTVYVYNFPPPNDIVARSAALSPTASTAPTRSTGHARVPRGSVAAPVRLVRRGRSICPWCSRGRRLFRHSGVTLEAQVAVSAPGTNSDGS